MAEERGRVIVLPTGYDPEGEDAPVRRKREEPGPCRHRETEINEAEARLICRRCGADVPPLEWIKHLARDWQEYEYRRVEAEQRAKNAEASAERRIKDAQRAAKVTASMPMPLGRRLARIGASIGRAQASLGEAFRYLAEVHDSGTASGMVDSCLRGAEADIERARAGYAKLVRDHARPRAGEAS